jgi:hypothetical protein
MNVESRRAAVCRGAIPRPLHLPKFLDSLKNGIETFVSEPIVEKMPNPEIELDPVNDPIVLVSTYPDLDWEEQIKSIKVREQKIPSAKDQKGRITSLLKTLGAEKLEPDSSQVEESLNWLANLETIIPDHNEFVASNFRHFFLAWKELLSRTDRKSARSDLSWIKAGFKPKFCKTELEKTSKREIVESMLKMVVRSSEVPRMLSGRTPHPIAFQNHQSLYTNWDFSKDQIYKLVQWGATWIWVGPEPPVVINPMGIADSAGKQRLIFNMRYPNLFLEALPFRYKRLRDILAFTHQGSLMASWDLKSGYYHVPIHKDAQKYFCFKVGRLVFYFKVLCFGFAQACYASRKSCKRWPSSSEDEGCRF